MTIRIGYDYDEPIFSWYQYAHEACIAAGLTTAEAPMPTRWDPHVHYECDLKAWVKVLDDEVLKGFDGLYGRPAIASAVKAVRRAYRLGYETHIITARGSFGTLGEQIKGLTRAQLLKEGIPYDGLHFGTHDKGQTIKDLGLDYYLDDKAETWFTAVAAGADAYLLDAPWNLDADVPEDKRVKSTAEFVGLIVKEHGNQTGKRPLHVTTI